MAQSLTENISKLIRALGPNLKDFSFGTVCRTNNGVPTYQATILPNITHCEFKKDHATPDDALRELHDAVRKAIYEKQQAMEKGNQALISVLLEIDPYEVESQ